MAVVTFNDLTTGTLEGTGVFDQLVKSITAHLDREYKTSRIKGTEYSQVYLGSLQHAIDASLQFLLSKQKVDLEAQLLAKQVENATKEGLVLDAQKCKLDAEFDLLKQQVLKVVAETSLLAQKKVTETAQTSGTGTDADSVVGKQKALYQAQTDGFRRDAEQKAAKLFADTWNVRRTTDEGTVADTTNKLDDQTIGRAMEKLLAGINA